MKIIDDIHDEAIYNAITKNIQKPEKHKLRVTELIDSPRIKQLRLKHWDDIQIPASKFLYRLRGTLMHDLVSRNATNNNLTEEHLTITITRANSLNQYRMPIYGTPDRYTPEEELLDYKYTSMWAFIRTKQEWIHQLNIYRRMLEIHGFKVSKMTIKAILDDWNASEASRNHEYPQSPFKAIDIPFVLNIDKYIEEQVDKHIDAITNLPLCSHEETWRRPTTWALTKKGNKKAKAVFGTDKRPGTFADAEEYLRKEIAEKDWKLFEIITRPGRSIRCEAYCDVSNFCDQWKAEKERTLNETNDPENS